MYQPGGASTANKEPQEIREQQQVARSQRLRAALRFIPESGYKMRKEFFVGKARGGEQGSMRSRSREQSPCWAC